MSLTMFQHINVTIAEKAVTLTLASLVWDLNDVSICCHHLPCSVIIECGHRKHVRVQYTCVVAVRMCCYRTNLLLQYQYVITVPMCCYSTSVLLQYQCVVTVPYKCVCYSMCVLLQYKCVTV